MIRLADFTGELLMTTDANAITTLDDIPVCARERGAKTALVFEGRKTTFAEFERHIASTATALSAGSVNRLTFPVALEGRRHCATSDAGRPYCRFRLRSHARSGRECTKHHEETRERVAGFKTPKSVDLVAALPRNASGKILRRELTSAE